MGCKVWLLTAFFNDPVLTGLSLLLLHPVHVDKSQPAERRQEKLYREGGSSLADDLEKSETLKTAWSSNF